VENQFVGAVALAGAQRPRHRRRYARAHSAVGGLQNEHHKWKRQRGAGERSGADAAKKEAIEHDHTNEREEIQDVWRCESQQCRQDRSVEYELGARSRGCRRNGRGRR
jgi:hypothetical protein